MRVTICELPDESGAFADAWTDLVSHVQAEASELVLLPEMPFHPWLPARREVDPELWAAAVAAHDRWQERLEQLAPAVGLGSRPIERQGHRFNEGFVYEPGTGYRGVHLKSYLPDEPGFWEASWYERGPGEFAVTSAGRARIGFQICTDLWFPAHARTMGQAGAQIIAVPRATPVATVPKWLTGGAVAAVVSGAFTISSNRVAPAGGEVDLGGVGWVCDPEGVILAITSPELPVLTIDLPLEEADAAKSTYPRYVPDL